MMGIGVNENQRIEYVFNNELFMSDIRLKSGKQTLRELEAVVGVSAATLSRWDKGMTLDMETFLRVCGKLQMQPENYFDKQVWELKQS